MEYHSLQWLQSHDEVSVNEMNKLVFFSSSVASCIEYESGNYLRVFLWTFESSIVLLIYYILNDTQQLKRDTTLQSISGYTQSSFLSHTAFD